MTDVNIPKEQWALVSTSKGVLQVKKIPVPEPANGQILIKVHASPINPSDLYCMKGMYDEFDVFRSNYPTVAGWEGSGVVVKSGGGMMANRCVGRNVSFVREPQGNVFVHGGAYQQYAIANAMTVNYVDDSIPLDVASMSFVNPLTALGLFEAIGKNSTKAAIQTGAASQLGRMLCQLCKEGNIPLINIVRR